MENFNDTTLSRLIDRAVQNNRNVGMALSRVEQARLNLKATQSQYWPSLQYSLQAQYGNETYIGTKSDKLEQSYIFRPTLTWELGLFGKVRPDGRSRPQPASGHDGSCPAGSNSP